LRLLALQIRFDQGRTYAEFTDPLGVFANPVLISIEGFHQVVRHFDGQSSLADIQARVLRETGQLIKSVELQDLVEQLDRALVLEGPTFAAFSDSYRQEGTRPAALAGRSYAGTERALRAQLAQFFLHDGGAGIPRARGGGRALRGVLSPHIDFVRGG